jgi:nucleoside-diphosphate-sugar epimerase
MQAHIAVTGATGFLGSHLVQALKPLGVVGVVRSPQKAPAGLEVRAGDLSDIKSLRHAFQGASVVVANAALGSKLGTLEDFLRTNVTGTENTLVAAAEARVARVILISTVAVYKTRLCSYMDETTERYLGEKPYTRRRVWNDLTTDWRYSFSKSIAEARAQELAATLNLSLTILRPGPIYGSKDTRFTARLLQKLENRLVFGPGVGIPMVHAGDVAGAVAGAIQNPASIGNAYNLAGPPVSMGAVLQCLKGLAKRGPVILPLWTPFWVGYTTTAAKQDLGFKVRELGEGLQEVLVNSKLL